MTQTDLLSVEQLAAVSVQRQGPCEATTGGGNWFTFRPSTLATEIVVLRDEKMALLLIVDDCHRIMEERANENDKLHDLRRAINEALLDADMEAGDREATLRNVRSLVCEINEGRERIENLQAAIRHANASILDYDDTEWERWNDLPGVRDALEVGP